MTRIEAKEYLLRVVEGISSDDRKKKAEVPYHYKHSAYRLGLELSDYVHELWMNPNENPENVFSAIFGRGRCDAVLQEALYNGVISETEADRAGEALDVILYDYLKGANKE